MLENGQSKQNVPADRVVHSVGLIYQLASVGIAVITLGLLLHSFVVTVRLTIGDSMLPNYPPDRLAVISRLKLRPLARGQVVLARYPGDPTNEQLLKRVVGLPLETVEVRAGAVWINGARLSEPYIDINESTEPTIAPHHIAVGEYYLLGDHRRASDDSRFFGEVPKELIIGQVIGLLELPALFY